MTPQRLQLRAGTDPHAIVDSFADTPEGRSEQLAILLAAYTSERAYDAQTLSAVTGVFATIIGVLSVVGSAVAFASLHPQGLPSLIALCLPVIPFPFLGWGAVCANAIIARGEVIDLYEAALRRAAKFNIGATSAAEGMPVPFGSTLVGRVWWGRGSLVMLIGFFVIALMYVSILAFSSYVAYTERKLWTLLVISFPCLAAFVFMLHTYLKAFGPRAFMSDLSKSIFGRAIPFGENRRAATKVWRFLRIGHRWIAPYVIAFLMAAGVGTYLFVHHQRSTPVPTPATRAVVYAAQLGAELNGREMLWVRRELKGKRSAWDVKFNDGTCFEIDTQHFNLAALHGFAVISCPG